MGTIYTDDLNAEILTQQMPTSDAFTKAIGGAAKAGIHHGLMLEFVDGTNWPMKDFSTRYLKIKAGKAVVNAVNTSLAAGMENILATAVAAADITIDLEGTTPPPTTILNNDTPIAASDVNDYYVILRIAYAASVVSDLTGLVSNAGQMRASIVLAVVTGSGFSGHNGVLLGKFNRSRKYLETNPECSLTESDVAFINGQDRQANENTKAVLCLQYFRTLNVVSFSNLRKHIKIENIHDWAVAQKLISPTMPLAGITGTIPATSTTHLSGWVMPIDWENGSYMDIYGPAKGVWKDVEKFDLFNCIFSGTVNMAFHRTPGSYEHRSKTKAQLRTPATIRAMTDYGSRQFIFDGKGSVFAGDLNIDLVLDFVGEVKDCTYRILFKNLNVKGNLTINYGQSRLGMAGGAQGTWTFEDCYALGTSKIRPWPQVTGTSSLKFDDAVGGNIVADYINNAGNITFSGWTAAGPTTLSNWQGTAGVNAYTKGVIVPVYLHNKTAGSGAEVMAMGNPWLEEGADGGFVFRRCAMFTSTGEPGTMLTEVMGAPVISAGVTWSAKIRVRLEKCLKIVKNPTMDSVGYRLYPSNHSNYAIGDGAYTLAQLITDMYWHTMNVSSLYSIQSLLSGGNISASGNLDAGNNIDALIGDITAQFGKVRTLVGNIESAADVHADANVTADLKVIAATNVEALQKVVSGGDTEIGGDAKITGNAVVENITSLAATINILKDLSILTGKVLSVDSITAVLSAISFLKDLDVSGNDILAAHEDGLVIGGRRIQLVSVSLAPFATYTFTGVAQGFFMLFGRMNGSTDVWHIATDCYDTETTSKHFTQVSTSLHSGGDIMGASGSHIQGDIASVIKLKNLTGLTTAYVGVAIIL